jgi:putative heme-binding domain-containing protein
MSSSSKSAEIDSFPGISARETRVNLWIAPMFSRPQVSATIFIILVAASSNLACSDEAKDAATRRFTAADVKQGKQSINAFCSRCHGRDGRGAKGPDLTDGIFRHAQTDEDLLRIISDGITGTGMPGMGGGFDDYYWPVIAYIRAEGKKNIQNPLVRPPAGNSAKGYQLFKKHQCGSCHWTGSEGGRRGTDLSKLSATADYVRESMRNPDSQIDGSYQPVIMVEKDGSVITGRRMHENTNTMLLMDDQENLRAFAKSEFDIRRPHKSLMSSYREQLSEQDIEDITTYLFSNRKAQTR